MKNMRKWLAAVFLSLMSWTASAAVTNTEATVTFTNQIPSRGSTTNGDTITINTSVRYYTNGALNDVTLWIPATNSMGFSATNTTIHFNVYGSGLGIDRITFDTQAGVHLSNGIRIVGALQSNLTVTLSAGVGTVSYVTNVWDQYKGIFYPVAGLPTEIGRTNNVNGFVDVMSDVAGRATNVVPNGIQFMSNFVDLDATARVEQSLVGDHKQQRS